MSVRYNSELIDSLYQAMNAEKASDIADEMKEIGDPIFISPIFAAYKKFRLDSRSHYFLVDLIGFKQPEAIEILKKLATETISGSADISYLIDFCIENNHFPNEFTRQVEAGFYGDLGLEMDSYNLTPYLQYFLATKKFSEMEEVVISIFEGEEFKLGARATALSYLVKYDTTKYLQHYYENYEKIKGGKAEIIFAKELNGWKNGIVPKFNEKIIKEGSERAREIIEEKLKKDKVSEEKKEAEKEKNIERKFSNAEIIMEIASIREKINILTAGDVRFGFPLLVPTELLPKQSAVVEDEHKLIGYAIELRTIVQGINENVAQHGFTPEEAEKHIQGIAKEGSINNLQLFLISRGVSVDVRLFSIRDINMTLAKLAHPTGEKKELVEQLQTVGLYDLYRGEDWNSLHKKLLIMYKDSLFSLYEAISKEEVSLY